MCRIHASQAGEREAPRGCARAGPVPALPLARSGASGTASRSFVFVSRKDSDYRSAWRPCPPAGDPGAHALALLERHFLPRDLPVLGARLGVWGRRTRSAGLGAQQPQPGKRSRQKAGGFLTSTCNAGKSLAAEHAARTRSHLLPHPFPTIQISKPILSDLLPGGNLSFQHIPKPHTHPTHLPFHLQTRVTAPDSLSVVHSSEGITHSPCRPFLQPPYHWSSLHQPNVRSLEVPAQAGSSQLVNAFSQGAPL